MKSRILLNRKRVKRVRRARAKIFGTAARPRLSVFRSNRSTYVQLIDDQRRHTIVSVSGKEPKIVGKKLTKSEVAKMAGELLAKKAKEKGIKEAVFDRRGYKYHGRIKAVADGARSGGLKF